MLVSNLPIGRRMHFITAAATMGLLVLLGVAVTRHRQRHHAHGIATKTRHVVEAAHGVLVHFEAEARAGRMTRDAGAAGRDRRRPPMRYEGSEYFWINDMQPRMVMHPIRPELDGKDLAENKDPTGKRLFVAFVDTVRKDGAGFVDYMWPKPGATSRCRRSPTSRASRRGAGSSARASIPTTWRRDPRRVRQDRRDRAAAVRRDDRRRDADRTQHRAPDHRDRRRDAARRRRATSIPRSPAFGARTRSASSPQALEVFRAQGHEAKRLAEAAAAEAGRARAPTARDGRLHGRFQQLGVRRAAHADSAAATQMKTASQSMIGTAEITRSQLAEMRTTSETSAGNLSTVAAASEEMLSSIGEIRRQIDGADRGHRPRRWTRADAAAISSTASPMPRSRSATWSS